MFNAFQLLAIFCLLSIAKSFISSRLSHSRAPLSTLKVNGENLNVAVELSVPLGDGYQTIKCPMRPIFEKSTFFIATYNVPFDINIEKPPKGFPAPIVTKDGPEGEKVGDVLRAATCWSQGYVLCQLTVSYKQYLHRTHALQT